MPVPPLPNELINLIFEHLWSILSTDPSTGLLVTPRNAPFIFAPFVRVSKTWRQLAAPFWHAHVEAKDREKVKAALKQYNLTKVVIRSLHFDPDIPRMPSDAEYEDYEDEYDDGWDGYGYGGGRRRDPEDEFWDEVGREGGKWDDIAASEKLEQLEMGPRPRLSRRRHNRTHYTHYNNDEEEAGRAWPVGQVLWQIWPFGGPFPHLRSLRLHLPAGACIRNVWNHTSGLVNLTHLGVTFLGPLALRDDSAAETDHLKTVKDVFLRLESLEILRLATNVEHLTTVVVPLLIKPASKTLRHLRLEPDFSEPTVSLTAQQLFAGCSFPRLGQFKLAGRMTCAVLGRAPFLPDAPALKEADVPLRQRCIFPAPPASVEHLSLHNCRPEGLEQLARTFHLHCVGTVTSAMSVFPPATLALRVLSIEFAETDPKLEPAHVDALRSLIAYAQVAGVELRGSWWPLLSKDVRENELFDPAAPVNLDELESVSPMDEDDEEYQEEEEEPERDQDGWTSEDEELDWDAEDDAQFRELWSEDKGRAHDFAQALSSLRQHFPTPDAFEGAKTAMLDAAEPFLSGGGGGSGRA
ncbi:hypothetical protein JCM6882_009255 [Rhodosporidiobolus microsporus]